MGQNLILNMNDHGFTVVAYNRTTSKVDEFLNKEAKGTKVIGAHSIEELVGHLKRPRRIMMLVKAGSAVDDLIEQLIPHLEKGDILIDGGNSLFQDTIRRAKYLRGKGLLFIGTGVSGGEEEALVAGPRSCRAALRQPGRSSKTFFKKSQARSKMAPVLRLGGENGAGHYVKMVHNGIEYGDMQLICEAYHLMKIGLGMTADEMHQVFAEWNKGDLDSFLIEITRDILAFKDTDGQPLVDKILDTAGQKGTGKWTVISSQELGIPITLMAEAVYSRCVSALKDERVVAAKKLKGPKPTIKGDRAKFIEDIRCALYASKIVSYAQGYMLAWPRQGIQLEAQLWRRCLDGRGGCIIRSRFLGKSRKPSTNSKLTNLLLDRFFRKAIKDCQRLAQRGGHRGQEGHTRACLQHRSGVLRRLSQRTFARQPSASPTRLLRRAYLRTCRQTARRVFPHQLDRSRGDVSSGTYNA